MRRNRTSSRTPALASAFSFGLVVAVTVLTWAFGTSAVAQAPTVCREWNFDSSGVADEWKGNYLSDLTVTDGVLNARFTGHDPFLLSPEFELAPRIGQYVEIRAKTTSSQMGRLYFASDHEGLYGGFSEQDSTSFSLIHDGQWHTYRIFPSWTHLSKIIRLRIDFGTPTANQIGIGGLAVDEIRIVDIKTESLPPADPSWTFQTETDGWSVDNGSVQKGEDGWTLKPENVKADSDGGSEPFSAGAPLRLRSDFFAFSADPTRSWVALTMKNAGPGASISFLGEKTDGWATIPFDADSDSGEFVTYNIPLSDQKGWEGTIYSLVIEPGASCSPPVIQKLTLNGHPQGPPRLSLKTFNLTEAFHRVSLPTPLEITLENVGGETAEGLQLVLENLPQGFSVTDSDGVKVDADIPVTPLDPIQLPRQESVASLSPTDSSSISIIPLGTAAPFETLHQTLFLTGKHPFSGKISYSFGDNSGRVLRTGSFEMEMTPPLGLPKADYVPEPQAAELLNPEWEIGALYFPGWRNRAAWERIHPVAPIRKPVLGWYDEGNPEVVDWQIKWARECGISFFLVDWYWNRGKISLDHWVQAFQKARYRNQFKWAMMWANHNGAGSHSVEDQTQVTQYWIDHYFKTPEYYRIDDKPVVMIWSPQGMDEDIRRIERDQNGRELETGEGVKILLDLSRRMAREAGLAGIYFIAMKWPEASTSAKDIEWLKRAGFDMTSLYHFMEPAEPPVDPKRFDFDQITVSSLPWWRSRHETGVLPFLPNLSTGWDDRPWNNQLVIANRTPEKFRKICEDLKTFMTETQTKRICLAPINEWGEGSYAEPNREFGFGMYEALRETFCKEPDGGWPAYYMPSDVGLGPYDYPAEPSEE